MGDPGGWNVHKYVCDVMIVHPESVNTARDQRKFP